MVTSGKQDIYLTINPEITFFKKVYRRHTNFSLELKPIFPEQPADFNNVLSFIINTGDAINRCYLEIELPNLSFSDKYISDQKYITRKKTDIANLNTTLAIWVSYYNNLKGYVNVEIPLYRILYNYLQSDNITLNTLKDAVTKYNYNNKTQKDLYKNNIDESVFLLIDMTGYIGSINLLITNTTNYDPSKYIAQSDILNNLNQMYASMQEYLIYYNSNIVLYTEKITEKSKDNQINFNFAEYLGHNFFEYFTFEIGGQEIQKYTNDILHINQMHRIKYDNMPNYLEMIGQVPELTTFNNDIKGGKKLIVPLIFWFNKDAGASLPLVSLQYSSIIINAKLNDIRKSICFENYEKMFNDILKVTISNTKGFVTNTNLIYNKYKFNIANKSISYECLFINDELLKVVYLDLTETERDLLLETNGTQYTQNQITKILHPNLTEYEILEQNGSIGLQTQWLINSIQWCGFMMDITNPIYTNPSAGIDIAAKVGSYYPYINFNLYYSLISTPVVRLVTEAVYLDDVERAKFADSKLEYVVEKINEDTFTIKNQTSFNCELSFNNPCKELIWYIQPQFFHDGISMNGQNISLLFDTNKYFTNSVINKQNLSLNQYDVLLPNIDMNYYTYLLSYKYLNNILPEGIYYNSFCLYPEESQPSGCANLRQIKGKLYNVDLNPAFLSEYQNVLNQLYKSPGLVANKSSFILKFIAKSYDLFIVHRGNAKLLFSTE